jgi:dihydrofolate synthase / folylpolyglutamate synthase
MKQDKKLINKIYSLNKKGIKLGLKNMQDCLKALDLDINKIKFIQIAGTNGKGSTASFLYNLLLKNKKKTERIGLYTSPHLLKYNERIKVNNRLITNHQIEKYSKIIFNKCKKISFTFFEFTTLLCFMHFVNKNVKIAILETGLGGKFDATNVVKSIISIITSISFDHTKFLGRTLKKITTEKAGIFKKDQIAIISDTKKNNLLKQIAKNKKVKKIEELGKDFNFVINKNGTFNFKDKTNNLKNIRKTILGDYQYKNASLAIKAFLEINKNTKNIKKAIKNTKWKARLERKKYKNRILYIDVSHNPEGVKETIKFLKKHYKKQSINIITGFLKDKDFKSIIKILTKKVNKIFIFPTKKIHKERGTTKKDFEIEVKKYKNVYVIKNINSVFEKIEKENAVSLFVGSIYNYEHIIKILKEKS